MKRYLIIVALILFAGAGTADAQKVGVKTNALYWATATPNLGLEFAIADRWTFEIAGGWNPWTFDAEKNIIAIKGPIPVAKDGIVFILTSVKS